MGYRSLKKVDEDWKRYPVFNMIFYSLVWTFLAVIFFSKTNAPLWVVIIGGIIYVLLIAGIIYTGISYKKSKDELKKSQEKQNE